jgi:hypothetical protein
VSRVQSVLRVCPSLLHSDMAALQCVRSSWDRSGLTLPRGDVVIRPPPAPCFASPAAGKQRIAAVSVGDNSTAAERFAANELADHLSNISGVHIPVLLPAAAQAVNHIAVGYYAALQVGLDPARLGDQLGDENFTAAAGIPASRPGGGVRSGSIALSGARKTPFLEPFANRNNHSTKTGARDKYRGK